MAKSMHGTTALLPLASFAFAAGLGGLLVVGGCNAVAGIEDPISGTPSGTSGTVPAGDGSVAVTGDARFYGTWTSAMPNQKLTGCALSITNSDPIHLTISNDATGPYITPGGTVCKVRVTIAGDVIVPLAKQSCSVAAAQETLDYDPTSTFTLLDQAGTSAKAAITAGASIRGTICVFSENSTYTKDP
jgi:hypothetical protein